MIKPEDEPIRLMAIHALADQKIRHFFLVLDDSTFWSDTTEEASDLVSKEAEKMKEYLQTEVKV